MNQWASYTSLDQKETRRSSWGALSAPEWARLGIEALGVVAVFAAVFGLLADFRARDEDRVTRAWQLVADGTGIRSALEILNRRGEDLSGLDLSAAYLRGAELYRAELEGASLYGAKLGDANLREANLADAMLKDAKLDRADLRNADLLKAYLKSADLRNADLREANIAGATLTWTDLRDADLTGAKLAGAIFCGSQMPDASVCNRDCDRVSEGSRTPVDRNCPWFHPKPG